HPHSFLHTRRPPRPPLFPYTTLFRSISDARERERTCGEQRARRVTRQRESDGAAGSTLGSLPRRDRRRRCVSSGLSPVHLARLGDRKSTRLNSSHVKISYAVFCLKKK